jgi:hypothetical protein
VEVADSFADTISQCAHCGHAVSVPSTVSRDRPQEVTAILGEPRPPAPGADAGKKYDFLAPPQGPDEIGRLASYRVLRVLGAGGMGVVFHAEDLHLRRPVALKCLLPTLATTDEARQRFLREARAAAAVEHDHIVVIYQVGEDRGIPFLAMQLLQGEALDARLRHAGKLPVPEILRLGREMATGLAAAHARGLIHRDIKPANVWLEAPQARVKLLDFGLARGGADDVHVTQQGAVLGTPAYMSPEQARGEPVDARSDLFSLGCVLYQMCTGQLPFQASSTVAMLVAVANAREVPPAQINQDIPAGLSDLVTQLLAKDPNRRPSSAQAVVDALRELERSAPALATLSAAPAPATDVRAAAPATLVATAVTTKMAPALPPPGRFRRWLLLVGVAAALLVVVGGVLVPVLWRPAQPPTPDVPQGVEIGVAYGTELKRWFETAVKDFAATPEGKNIKIHLLPLGSLEGAQAVGQQEDKRIHVWAPASSLYRGMLVKHWRQKHAQGPILKEESLALTPLVFVFWEERYQAFVKKYGAVTFATIAQALAEPGGWGAIAGQPDWGKFQFSHTDPAKSNSGLMTLVIMAQEYHRQGGRLSPAEAADAGFQAWLAAFEKHLPPLSPSTGKLMEEMVSRGPASFDALVVYENLVGDYFQAAEGRWGKLAVAYPPRNMWSDHPYYLLDVPWSSPDQRRAAEAFLRFLMSEPQQRAALAHGFRPGNLNVPILGATDSPFVRYPHSGLHVDLHGIVPPPGDQVVERLLALWEKTAGRKD